MNKKLAIAAAYGEHWNFFKHHVNEDGWCFVFRGGTHNEIPSDIKMVSRNQDMWRPKSIAGIDDNNGWFEIKKLSDIPKSVGKYMFIESATGNREVLTLSVKEFEYPRIYIINVYSHFRPIDNYPNPIY